MHLKNEKEKDSSVSELADVTGLSKHNSDVIVDKDLPVQDHIPCQSSGQSSTNVSSSNVTPLSPKLKVIHASDTKPLLTCGVPSINTVTSNDTQIAGDPPTNNVELLHESSANIEDGTSVDSANSANDSIPTASRHSKRISERIGELVIEFLIYRCLFIVKTHLTEQFCLLVTDSRDVF